MIGEQIKNEISEEVKKQLQQNSIEAIVLNSRYQVLTFNGTADNSNLALSFPLALIQNKRILIKSIKSILYAPVEMDELFNNTTGDHYTIAASIRINKLPDRFARANTLELLINGVNQNIFPENIAGAALNGLPGEIFVDNIYLNYKANIQDFLVRSNILITDNLDTGAVNVNPPFIRVMIECYLY